LAERYLLRLYEKSPGSTNWHAVFWPELGCGDVCLIWQMCAGNKRIVIFFSAFFYKSVLN
jgi:hypothetical protein